MTTPKDDGDVRAADILTLRDYIAIAVLPTLVTNLKLTVEETCDAAYDYADEMLASREATRD